MSQMVLIWGVFVMTQLVITGISFAIPAQPSVEPYVAYLLGFPALVTAGISVAGGMIPQLSRDPRTGRIVRWALAEAATIFGFVSWFMSGERIVQIPCLGLALVALAVAFPRTEKQ